ncbi:MAG: cytochrome c [Luteitalea sp.]|nr:cytochrome c [Luteitalea sp.]
MNWRTTAGKILIAAALAVVLVAAWAVGSIASDRPEEYGEITEHFKYGSIGSEPGGSLLRPVGGALPPYWMFRMLPSICRDKLPGGYASLGLVTEPGRDLPIGISRRRRLGVDQVGFNCAICHTGTVRDSPGAPPRVVLGMPSHQLDLQRLVEFVIDCSLDNRMTRDTVLGRAREMDGDGPSLFERLLLRLGLVNRLKIQVLDQRNRIEPVLGDRVPRWGRGRVDTFNPYKSIQFNWPLDELPPSELIGASDFPSIWNQAPREGMHLHWDGDNDSVDERNLSAALGAGVTPVTVDHAAMQRVRDWIWTLPPPKYPYAIDQALAARGLALYTEHCRSCHADERFREGVVAPGTRVGQVVPIADIGTDRHRLDSYTDTFATNQYALYPDSRYRFSHFRKTGGYANHPLDGIWLRGPFLHNGSVPTLRDLLDAPEARPKAFYRGYDLFDQTRVGFVSDVPRVDGHDFSLFDTAIPGNANTGHVYGTTLSDVDKAALVEHLKTF